jgi:hypothetical protein
MADHLLALDKLLRESIAAACAEWGWREPTDAYFTELHRRLPAGLRAIVARGHAESLIVTNGWKFTLKDLTAAKGPYQWFSKRRWNNGPHPNWEYFVQVAEYVRLHRVAVTQDLRLTFEDDLMDLALYRGPDLLVCVEAKERMQQLEHLIKALRRYERAVDFSAPDRGNDPFRKAKYIVRHRPRYFCAVALGGHLEFRVDYPFGRAFLLSPDMIPWI